MVVLLDRVNDRVAAVGPFPDAGTARGWPAPHTNSDATPIRPAGGRDTAATERRLVVELRPPTT